MIRINLLDSSDIKKRKRQTSSASSFSAFFILLFVVEILGLYYWGDSKTAELEKYQKSLTSSQASLNRLKGMARKKEGLEKELETIQKQAYAFSALDHGRTGPSNMLLFLSYILTPESSRVARGKQEEIDWNTGWDTDRGWFTGIKDRKEGGIVIEGEALTFGDMYEIFQRLKSSIYFQELTLLGSKQKKKHGKKSKAQSVEFRFGAYMNYDVDPSAASDTDEAGKKKG
mgnify:CR=1 FL=1